MADDADPADQAPSAALTEAPPDDMSPQDRLANLTAKATAEYAVKHYNEAAELYSQATEIQAELNGDMAVENADLLYAYGKCLFFLAQQTSSVLGGTAASAQLNSKKEKKAPKKRKLNGTQTNGEASSSKTEVPTNGDSTVPNVGDVIPEEDVKPETKLESDKPYFQIEGDAPGWDSDEDEEEGDEQAEQPEEEDEQDDFADAYEMLDLARILYLKKLDQSEQSTLEASEKGKYVPSIDLDPSVKEVKTRIADIHDLQAEVLLEGEKYAAAVEDLQKCLALQEELVPPESSLLAECHYKLSLALEFSSQSQQRDTDGNPIGDIEVDWTIRNEAIAQQEKAIESCKLRIAKETEEMEALEPGKEKDKMMAQIEDVQDMVVEMEVRMADLRKPPVNVKEETQMKEQLSGVLGSILGASAEEQKATLAKAAAGAADISGLVKKKKGKSGKVADGGEDSGFGSAASTPAPEPVVATSSKVNGKRKVEFVEGVEELGKGEGKRAKVEDAEDSGL
jgi:HAT1-interacting factor 1